MRVEKFSVTHARKLSEEVMAQLPDLSYNQVQKLIRNKDIKVNGKRVGKDIKLEISSEVECYLAGDEKPIDILYEDKNLLVCFKPRKLEVVSTTGEIDLVRRLEKQTNCTLSEVHRLDRNTMGLVILSKNNSAKKSLENAIKAHKIQKFYLADVYGVLENSTADLVAYLYKDAKNSVVKISDVEKPGYTKIETKYKVVSQHGDHALLEVELVTGKTHQIRAHLSHIGHFVIGDEKYGNSEINKHFKKHYQCLCASKLIFHFTEQDPLSYLDGKMIKIDENNIEL